MKEIAALLLTIAGIVTALTGLVTGTTIVTALGYIIVSGPILIVWDIAYEAARVRASEFIIRTKKFQITQLEHCYLISEADKPTPRKVSITENQLQQVKNRIFPEPTIVDSSGHVITTLEEHFVDQNGVKWHASPQGWVCESLI